MPRPPNAWLLVIALAGASACSLSPVHRKIDVGEEPFVVFVAEGSNGHTDLFAATPTGGTPVRLTFTTLVEERPLLSGAGDVVAFVRHRGDGTGTDLVVLNLLNGAERLLELPDDQGAIDGLGWSNDNTSIYLRTGERYWRVTAPPAPMAVALLASAEADSARQALTARLGTPAFATATECAGGGICVTGPSGEQTVLSASGAGPFRWGSDSLAWFDAGTLVVRPLGGGSARTVRWGAAVANPRDGSYAEPSP